MRGAIDAFIPIAERSEYCFSVIIQLQNSDLIKPRLPKPSKAKEPLLDMTRPIANLALHLGQVISDFFMAGSYHPSPVSQTEATYRGASLLGDGL